MIRRREIFGWAMFDFANSSYTTVIVTVAFSVYFARTVAPTGRGDFLWSVGLAISNLAVILISPLVGALADGAGARKGSLIASGMICSLATAALALVGPGDVVLGLVIFTLSNVAFALGENLTASFLPELSTPDSVGRISGYGWGLGYLGGLASLLLVRPFLADGFGADNASGLRSTWLTTGLFFAVSAIPTLIWLRDRGARTASRGAAALATEAFRRLQSTAKSVSEISELAKFLLVFMVICSGLMSVISFAGIYAERTFGFSGSDLVTLFLLLQVSSALGAVVFGRIQDGVGALPTVRITLWLWLTVSLTAAIAQTQGQFWLVAIVAGLGIGSLQSASRALVAVFSPAGKAGEIFGFWGLAMRVAYGLGPLAFGAISSGLGSQRLAVATTAIWFVGGLVGLTWIDENKGRKEAAAWKDC